jgi:uncharacterized RDD family membrane protein YckC
VSAPEKLTIETPEQVRLEFTLAGIGSRFLALCLDTLLQIAVFLVLLLAGLATTSVAAVLRVNAGTWVVALLVLAGFILYYGYFAIFEALWNGQTPGKRIIGLRVMDAAGRPVGTYEAILRNVVRIADQMPGIYAIGILSVLLTERNQRLGDLAAGTVVVHERPIERHGLGADAAPAQRTRYGATRLSDDEIAIVETFLRRRIDLPDGRRTHTAREIARRIRGCLGLTADEEDELFLEQVATEYRTSGRYR